MFNHNLFSCQSPVSRFFSFRQRMIFGLLERRLAIFMKFCQSLIASICQNVKIFRKLTGILFEQLEVVFASTTKGGGYDLGTFLVSNYLHYLGVTLQFAVFGFSLAPPAKAGVDTPQVFR